jgi:hypothetical protein
MHAPLIHVVSLSNGREGCTEGLVRDLHGTKLWFKLTWLMAQSPLSNPLAEGLPGPPPRAYGKRSKTPAFLVISRVKKRNTSMTTKESLSHQAPAGHKTADPTTAVRGPLAETEHQGASHAEEHVEDLDQAPEEEAYGSDAFSEVLTAEEVKKRGVEFASAVKFIATKYPDAKEAILILVQTAVEKIVKAGDLDAVVDELAEHFDSDIGLWYDLVSYLTSGEPKAAGLVRKIVELLMTSSTAPPSPSTLPPDKLVMDASVYYSS